MLVTFSAGVTGYRNGERIEEALERADQALEARCLASSGEALGAAGLTSLPVIAFTMVVVGLLAAFGPARRGLRLQPTEALRDQ